MNQSVGLFGIVRHPMFLATTVMFLVVIITAFIRYHLRLLTWECIEIPLFKFLKLNV